MNNYLQLKESHQKEFDNFPIFFAFSDKQFAEGMAKFGLAETDTDKIYKLGDTGGFYLKTDGQTLAEMLERHKTEMAEGFKNDEFLFDAIRYELSNYEFAITFDPEPTLEAIGFSLADLENERIKIIFNKAKAQYLKDCN